MSQLYLTEKQVRIFGWLSWIFMIVAGISAILAGFSVMPKPGSEICGIISAILAYLSRAFEQKLQPTGSKVESPSSWKKK